MMDISVFAQKVQERLLQRLGTGFEVMVQKMEKNNGVHLWGVMIMANDRNVTPTIYLEPFWKAYENGIPMYLLVDKLLQIYEQDAPGENVDMDFFQSFEKVQDRICYKLIHAGANEELLEKIPHMKYLDLAICFYYAYENKALGDGAILIRNTHMEGWRTSVEELFRLAEENTGRLLPPLCEPMDTVLEKLIEGSNLDVLEESTEFFEKIPMMVLGNHKRTQGAVCMIYPKLLEQIAKKMEVNLYILPSSIHEVILLPDKPEVLPMHLKEMIREVNATWVEPEEKLSDSLYYYNRAEHSLQIV